MKQIIPAATITQFPTADIQLPKPKAKSRRATQTNATVASVSSDTNIRPFQEIIYETPKSAPFREDNNGDDYDDYDEFLE